MDKEQIEKQEAHIIETFEIKPNLKDVKTNANMVDVDTLKHILLMNHHVSEITPQVLMILNNVLLARDHHFFYKKKLQLLKVDNLEVQGLEFQVLNIETSDFQVLEIHVSDIQVSKVHILVLQ